MQKLKILYADGREEVVPITPRAEVDWERHFDKSIGSATQRNEYMYYLALKALDVAGRESRPFDEFLAAVEKVELVVDEPADPTQPAQLPDASTESVPAPA